MEADPPTQGVKIARRITRFILKRSRSRANRLGDRFEGARGLATRKEEWKAYCPDYFRQAIRSAPGQTENIAAELMEEQAERLFRDFEARGEREVLAGMQMTVNPKRCGGFMPPRRGFGHDV